MPNTKQRVIKFLSWIEEHSRRLRETLLQEKKGCALSRAAFRQIISAYNNADPSIPKTALENKMYTIAKNTYDELTKDIVE